jgi:DNA polymerase-3 subunit epsilon
MLMRLSLRLRIFLLFAGLAGASLAAVAVGLWLGYRRLAAPDTLDAFVQGGVIAGFVILGVVAWVWYLFDLNVAKPIDRLSGSLRAGAHADVAGAIAAEAAPYLGDLAPAASAAAGTLAETRSALAQAVARETTRLSGEKRRLETLLADVSVGVILCSGDHALAFYNGQAVDLMGAGTAAPTIGPGLNRHLFDYLRDGPIRLAHDRLRATGDPDAASDLLCSTLTGARVLSARMRLLRSEDASYVLTLRDVTADLAAHARREALLTEVFDRVRRPAANLSTLLAAIPEGDAIPGRLDLALRDEVAALAQAVTDLSRRHDESRGDGLPVTMTRASDLLDGLRARMEGDGLTATTDAADVLLRCNGFEVIALLAGLAEALAGSALARDFRVVVEEDGTGALIRISWQGAPLAMGQLERWLDAPLEKGLPEVTRRSVLAAHGTEIWPETAGPLASLCLPIAQARRDVPRPTPIVRPVVYDFDLLSKARSLSVSDSRLEDLTYVVFDTETTGLQPAQDEIVQIAAVRIVNGRRIEAEVFETLVNPRRPIPRISTNVHGITDAMVQDAPEIQEVARRFHRFAEGAVLVAHNAPFDMAFLRRLEPDLGVRFDHPVFDTVLMSAVVYGQHEVHSLDALTHRLGITIAEEARHTAFGDTIATADAFLKLLPMLQGRGMATFGAVLAEMRRHGRLLKDLN